MELSNGRDTDYRASRDHKPCVGGGRLAISRITTDKRKARLWRYTRHYGARGLTYLSTRTAAQGEIGPAQLGPEKAKVGKTWLFAYLYNVFRKPLSTRSRTKLSSKKSRGLAVFAAGILSARLSSTAFMPFSEGAGALSKYFPEYI